MNIIKLVPENRRSYCEDCGDCLQIVGQGNYDRCIACEDRKQKAVSYTHLRAHET